MVVCLVGFGLYNRSLVQYQCHLLEKLGIDEPMSRNEIKALSIASRRAIWLYQQPQILADWGVDAVLAPEGALPFCGLG